MRRSKRLHHWVPQNTYHRSPPHEDKQAKQSNLRHKNKKICVTYNGKTKNKSPIKMKGRILRKRAKWNWGKQSIINRIQNNSYKDAQKSVTTTRNFMNTTRNLVGTIAAWKKDIETMNKEQDKMKNTIFEGLISKIYKKLIWLNTRMTKNPIKKEQRIWIDTSPRRT